MSEIEENGYNLNIPRYVDTAEVEESIDLDVVATEIADIDQEIEKISVDLKTSFEQLGIQYPF